MPNNQSHHVTSTKERVHEPLLYSVIMHNDDFTPMDFVVSLLRVVFFKPIEVATSLMLDVHQKGSAIVGTYSYDIAKSKAKKAMDIATENSYPLKLTIEPVDLPF